MTTKKVENHYKAAIKYGPEYPYPYYNLIYVWTEQERFEEMERFMNDCLKIPIIDKSTIYNRFGVMEEFKGNFSKAIENYKKAIKICLNDEKNRGFQKEYQQV